MYILKISILLLSTFFFTGCINKPEPRTSADLDADYKYCYKAVEGELDSMKEYFSSSETESIHSALTDACLEEQKGWDNESINWMLNYQYETRKK